MSDIAMDLNPNSSTYGDILVVNSDLTLNSGITQIKQHILQRLRTYFGEWFLDNTIGVPYYQQILVKNPEQAKIDAALLNTILGTPGVVSVNSYSFSSDFVNRQLTVTFSCQTTSGIVDYSGLV